ncbi:unnamed protein product [Larinioides sclopetarius]|uniref:Uncharacterized protein n=2 Tax=Larinioides sclopetarius TaxID=280406 RepID=A0AAV1ZE06_9ARAC
MVSEEFRHRARVRVSLRSLQEYRQAFKLYFGFTSKNMEELIRQGLPGVDEATIENVIEHLKDLGMIYTEDCQYVEEAYLTHLLKPIHVKKLLSFFKKFSSETIAQPNIVYNLEFEEKNNKVVTESPVPFFSSSAVPSIIDPLASTSTFDSSFGYVNEPNKNWADSFIIPWSSFPREVATECDNKKRLRKTVYSEMVRILAENISRINPSPGRNNLRIIAKKVVARYPETFEDRCGDSIIGGCSTLMKKIEHCLENRNRRKDFSDLFEIKTNDSKIKKTSRNSYACSNWQPNQLPDGESKASQLQHKNFLLKEHKKLVRDEETIKQLMITTYASQRYTINSKNSVKVIKEEWPTLFETDYFINHAALLLGRQSICDTICNNIISKGKIIYDFFKTMQNNSTVSKCLNVIESAKVQLESTIPEIFGGILLIPAFFGEEENALFQINMDPVSTTELEINQERLTPFISTSGGNIFTAQEFLILIDGSVALQTTDFKLAMALLVLSFFVFNIEYPEKAGLTMEFIQSSEIKYCGMTSE